MGQYPPLVVLAFSGWKEYHWQLPEKLEPGELHLNYLQGGELTPSAHLNSAVRVSRGMCLLLKVTSQEDVGTGE